MNTRPSTMDELEARRAQLQQEAEETAARMRLTVNEIFAPTPAGNKVQSLMNNAGRLYAVYDGVMLGFKLFRQFNGLFRKKRK